MQEIFKKLNRQTQTEKTEIEFETNLQNIIGASMTKEHRLVYFETEQTEPFYIDFVPHSGTTNAIYLIPSYHLLYLPNSTTNFHCINVPHSCINDIEKYWIYNLKYKSEKSIVFETNNIYLHNRIITQGLASNFPTAQIFPSIQYILFAEKLSHFISQSNITHQLSILDLIDKMCITKKTINRFCDTIFSASPSTIIRYHLILKTAFMIISCKLNSFTNIADDLEFKNLSAFGRYVKTFSGFTPKEIRENYAHLNL